MNLSQILIYGFLVLLLIVLAVVYVIKNRQTEPDYYSFFIIGSCWIPVGLAFGSKLFAAAGLVFAVFGLSNKSKWTEKGGWQVLSKPEKKSRAIVLVLFSLILVAGIVLYELK
jgi:hypothetical protein